MELGLLKNVFIDLLERLDQYYDNKLMKEPRVWANFEYNKEELIQNLAVEVYTNYNRPAYAGYDPETYIWIKAKNVWIDFMRQLKRNSEKGMVVEIEAIPEEHSVIHFLHDLENRNTIALIENVLNPHQIGLLRDRSMDMSYEEIFKKGGYPSPDAAKTQFNRLKKYILKRFNRP